MTWTQVSSDGGYTRRDDLRTFSYDGKVWISQGYDVGNVNRTDLLSSANGQSFTVVNANVPYGVYSPICVHDGYIFTVDSDTGIIRKTLDGVNYTTVSATNSPVNVHTDYLVSLNGCLYLVSRSKLWKIDLSNPVWSYTDLPWPHPKNSYSAVVFRNKIWVVCGDYEVAASPPEGNGVGYSGKTSLNDVWSFDGSSWVDHGSGPFSRRMWPALVVKGPYMYMAGGYNNVLGTPNNFGDTWRTFDGYHWQQIPGEFPARHAPALYVHNDEIYICGGNTNTGSSTQKDIWKLAMEGVLPDIYKPVFYTPTDGKFFYDSGTGAVEISGVVGGVPVPASYRYWCVENTNASTSQSWHNEIEMHDSTGQLSLAGKVTSSGSFGSFNASNLTDGNTASTSGFWLSNSSGVGNRIIADFGVNKSLTQVAIWSSAPANDVFLVKYSADGVNWVSTGKTLNTTGTGSPHKTSVTL